MPNTPDSGRSSALSVALIVPNDARRRALVAALAGTRSTITQEIVAYPSRDDLPKIARLDCDVLIVDLDDDLEQAIHVIANICSYTAAVTVMACSSNNDPALLRRAMQAGVREFLNEPFVPKALAEAFARTSSRRPDQKKAAGKALVFVPAEGGVGVTTVALNFAVALVKESGARVVAVDMDFQLGEIATGLGLTASFSVMDALTQATRLDREFLSTLLIRHDSGLAVLASPDAFNIVKTIDAESARKLLRILREEFDYVVVDSGTCYGDIQEMLFEKADTLYLVTEMTFPSLRNARRIISGCGTRRSSSSIVSPPNSRRSRSIVRGPQGRVRTRPSRVSMSSRFHWSVVGVVSFMVMAWPVVVLGVVVFWTQKVSPEGSVP